MLDLVKAPLSLILFILLAVLGIVALVGGLIILWLWKLMTAFIFALITILSIWVVLHESETDVGQHPWIIALPLPMFFVGFFIERCGLLTVQPLSVEEFATLPLSVTTLCLIVVVLLLCLGLAFHLTKD